MARKIEPKTGTPRGADALDDLEVLHPEREVRVRGRTLVIREYGFWEGLRIEAEPVTQQVLEALVRAAQAGEDRSFEQILGVLAEHPDALLRLVAVAADVDPEFLSGPELGDAEGQNLLMTWWLVNGGFFVRRVVRRLAIQQAAALRTASAGPTSSTSSRPPATDAPTSSASAIPGGN